MHLNLFFLLGGLMFAEQTIGGRIDESNYPQGTIVVQPGQGTLTAALAQLKGRSGPQAILLQPGDYYDNAVLKGYNAGVVLQGAQGSASSYRSNRVRVISSKKGLDVASALQVVADNVEVYSITFINNFGTGHDTQAVALTAAGNNQIYGQCSFQGYQDTLYDKSGKHLFDGCEIIGAMDFIFGSGTSFYSNPQIGILKSVSGGKQVITANRAGIFVFQNPNIQDIDGAAAQSTYYGRAWGSNPKVVMQNAKPPASLNKDGWNMKAAGNIEFSSAGFLEYPVAQTTNGHTSSKAYTKQEIFG
ncbi:family 8 carbohydrate esterase [Melampsora larici-populina 98AG31]|uniref:pectinesterase n=1 Tax=Melampsora larici-populina (strain 98AG31 / pathotype 3-4-7) TaxID=747676 RepID=F4RWB5_MELLP|nr:family 8 carbohydrate esterase [Melampsora larici-populina 98AG31]EGG03351.1 family 8 carbohydrate esterase [Melampsora larici-populina 98AG31]